MNTQTSLHLPRQLVNSIMTHAQKNADREACGLLGSSGTQPVSWYPVGNIAADPVHRFEMDPRQQVAAMRQMREAGEELFAIVHSHPDAPAVPSAADVDEIGYPDAYYLIVSLSTKGVLEMRCFRQAGGAMRPVELVYENIED